MNRKYLTAKEVAKMLRTSPGHLANERMMGRDHPPYLKFRRKILYCLDDLEKWLEERKIKTRDE